MLDRKTVKCAIVAGLAATVLSGCSRDGKLDLSSGVGIGVTRSGCPAVAVPDHTGDITIFSPANSTDASAIDVCFQYHQCAFYL